MTIQTRPYPVLPGDPDKLPRLNEIGFDEARCLARQFKPEMTEEEFQSVWNEFHRLKTLRRAN